MTVAFVTVLLILITTIGFLLFTTIAKSRRIHTYTYIEEIGQGRAWNSYPSMDVYELLHDGPSPNVASHAVITDQNCVRINSS
jgi:hypothetical protein